MLCFDESRQNMFGTASVKKAAKSCRRSGEDQEMAQWGGTSKPATIGRYLVTGSCLAALAALSQPAWAEEGAPAQQAAAPAPAPAGPAADASAQPVPAPAADQNTIGEIVVTARYVSENIQDTPIAITAQTGEELKAANVTQVSELGAVVPNLQTVPGDSQSAGTPIISMRGVQQGATSSLAVPPAVAIYTDDIYHSTTAGSELDFTDVVRVEVNRGPQSTLSGNASIAGSIKLYTQDPKGDGSGFATVAYGSRDHMEASGAIDLGLTPTLALRAFGHFNRQTGFGNRLDFTCMMNKQGTPELAGSLPPFQPDSEKKDCIIGHTGGGNTAAGQIKLQWKPTDDIKLLLTASHRREDLEETPEVTYGYTGGCVVPTAGYPDGIGPQPCKASAGAQLYTLAAYNVYGVILDNRFVPQPRDGGIYDTYATNCRPKIDLSAQIPSPVAGGKPTTFPSYYSDNICYQPRKFADHTLLSAKLEAGLTDNINMTAIAGYTDYSNEFTQNGDQSPLGAVISHFINKDKMYSGELRFDGKLLDDKLQWVLGGFAVKTDGYQNNYISFINIQQVNSVHGINKSESAFAHLDYNLTDRWRISGGGRFSHTDIAITIDNPQAVSVLDPVHSTQNRIDWLLSTDYKITDDIMVYATAATGSRPPGLTTIILNARQLVPTSAEELINYEVGVKADLLNRHLRTNLTAFYLDYQKLSTSVFGTQCLNEPGTGVATWYPEQYDQPAAVERCKQYPGNPETARFSTNVGIPATVKGIEWEIAAIPFDGLHIDWTGGYNHFKSGAAVGQPGYLYRGNYRQPEWNMHADVSYDIDTKVGTFTPRVDWSWQSKQTFDPSAALHAPDPDFVIKPYSLWNAQVAYESPDRNWSAVLQVTNLADKYYHFQLLRGSINKQTRVGAPREWLLTLRRNF
jgi:iron complex outermembrane receptor protein